MRLIYMSGWERICAIVFLSCISIVRPMDVKVFRQGFGKNAVEMVDETQFQNPTIISFSSDDEIMKKVDFSDEYDELVPKLPRYEVHQYGKNIGYTLVPIVTRSKPYWSTPMPRILLEKTCSTPDEIREMTKSWKVILKSTTPLPRTKPDEELLPPETNELPKKHHLSANRRPASEFLTGNGRHVITATSNESPVEIIMAPQTQKPIAHQKPVSDHSTQFRLLPGPHRHSSTSNNGAWSWRRQWTIGPDGKRVEVFSASGNVPKDRIPTNHHQNSQNSPNSPNLTIQPQQTKLPVTQQTETQTKFTTLSQKTGVTKCRVLDAVTDGKPAADNDFSCKLLYPGYPVDNSCKCSFHANGRDEQGCAVGFLYSCKPAENFAQTQ